MKIILASSSLSRRQLIKECFPQHEIVYSAPEIDEKIVGQKFRETNDAESLVSAVANAKATAMKHIDGLVVTCDQVAVCNNIILEKPIDAEQVREFFRMYNNYPVETCLCIVVSNGEMRVEGIEWAKQSWINCPFPDELINQLISKGLVFGCCGGFTIEDGTFINLELLKRHLGSRIGGADSIMGLSKKLVTDLVAKFD